METQWEHTAWLIAKLHNVNCTKKSDLVMPDDVNPYPKRRQKRPVPKVGVDVLRVFVDGKIPEGVSI